MQSSARLFNCARCRCHVVICSHCDRGNIYCGGRCSQRVRRQSVRAAGRRYRLPRSSPPGGLPPGYDSLIAPRRSCQVDCVQPPDRQTGGRERGRCRGCGVFRKGRKARADDPSMTSATTGGGVLAAPGSVSPCKSSSLARRQTLRSDRAPPSSIPQRPVLERKDALATSCPLYPLIGSPWGLCYVITFTMRGWRNRQTR